MILNYQNEILILIQVQVLEQLLLFPLERVVFSFQQQNLEQWDVPLIIRRGMYFFELLYDKDILVLRNYITHK